MKSRKRYLYKVGDIVYCNYFDRQADDDKKSFAFILGRTVEQGEWGTDILYLVVIQNAPFYKNYWLHERDIIKVIDRKPYIVEKKGQNKKEKV